MKMSEFPLYPIIQTTITDITMSKRNRIQKNLYCPVAFTCKVQKQAKRTTVLEIRTVVTWRGGGSGRWLGGDLEGRAQVRCCSISRPGFRYPSVFTL